MFDRKARCCRILAECISIYNNRRVSRYKYLQSEHFIYSGEHKNICVVGDDDQSIYSFNVDGETFSYFLDSILMRNRYMETNYRSCKRLFLCQKD